MANVAPDQELWGGETRKAIDNFQVSGEPIPTPVARWLGRIKGAAARVNAELGLLDGDKAERIAAAADRIAAGELDDQFPIDVFQTGSGTSSNMNANEVIAALAGEGVHANDDVNLGQSSNDVFPSAVHLAALDLVYTGVNEDTRKAIHTLEDLDPVRFIGNRSSGRMGYAIAAEASSRSRRSMVPMTCRSSRRGCRRQRS